VTVLTSFVSAGIPPVSAGLIQPPDSKEYRVSTAMGSDSCYKLVLKDGRLLGALIAGDIEAAGLCTSPIKCGDHASTSSWND